MKTAKSKNSTSQIKLLPPVYKPSTNKSFRKDTENLIEDKFYTLSLPFFIQEAKKRKEKEK